jgi:opacity protein-like surface antigen
MYLCAPINSTKPRLFTASAARGLAAGATLAAALLAATPATADENLFGYLAGAEPTPKGHREMYAWLTHRWDKGAGQYDAYDLKLEYEQGITDRLAGAVYLKGQAIDTSGIRIDGYLPADNQYGMRASGVEASIKYAFLTPALDDIGLAAYFSFSYDWLDAHSGQDKNKYTAESKLLLQKYALDGQLVFVGNLGLEATYSQREPLANLPINNDTGEPLEWPTTPEMEIGLLAGVGVSYRFAPNWYIGAETLYDTEFETEVGQERWSWQAGPTLHYGAKKWWATLTWFTQVAGGGEQFGPGTFDGQPYPGQDDSDLHLIEKTKHELRLKLGYNF